MGACIGRICEPFTARSHDRLTASFAEAALHPLETPPETPTGGLLQNGNKPSEEDEDDDDDGYESAKSDFSTCTWSSERSVGAAGSRSSQRTPPPPRLATLASPQPTARGDGGDPKDHDGDACTPDAWRALSEATAHLEDDALDRLEDDTPGASKRTKSRLGVAARLAKVAAGMRILRAVGRAIYSAGGALDLTGFGGTPIRWHSGHSTLRTHHRGESTLRKSNGEPRPSRAARMFCQTDRDFGRALGTVRLSICDSDNEKDDADPAIDGDCGVFPDGATPEGNILRVVRSIICDLDVPRHLQKPFNPILGETARHELQLVGGCKVKSVIEQVSHHPPITAFHCDGDGDWVIRGYFQPRPRLLGVHAVEVEMLGRRMWEVGPRDRREIYESDYCGFLWKFLPRMKTSLSTQTWFVECKQTMLRAEVTHGRKRSIKGRVFNVLKPSETLFAIDGAYDSCVFVKEPSTTKVHVLYDAEEAAAAEEVEADVAFQLPGDEKSSERVWGSVIDAMNRGAWDEARAGKRRVEEAERKERRRRKDAGEGPWRPRFFEDVDGDWVLRRLGDNADEPRGAPPRPDQ